jgi:hypothetical protein
MKLIRQTDFGRATSPEAGLTRRRFVGVAAFGAVAAPSLAAGVDEPATKSAEANRLAEPAISADVLVVGGGPAGATAAIQAARAGARTVLVEMSSQLGGTATIGGVSYPGLFHAWGRQVIAGIGWELVLQAVDLDGGRLPDFTNLALRHSQHQVRVNGPLYAALIEEACLEAGVTLRYYEWPRAIQATAGGWQVELVGKGVEQPVACRQLIDCTGGADVVGLLGLPRLREPTTQPGTLIFQFEGYEAGKLDAALIQERYQEALRDGRLIPGDYSHTRGRVIGFLQGGGNNAQHVPGADSSTSVTKTQANVAGRKSMLRLLRFIRTLPGCEQTRLRMMAAETGVRETQITVDDYTRGRVFEDAVCYAFYPIDIHDEHGVVPKPLAPGVVPTVPLGALVPKGSRNLLAAGRCVSSDRAANSALRVQASCMAMGQAAGAAAALAAQRNLSPREVPLADLKDLLRQHGALTP